MMKNSNEPMKRIQRKRTKGYKMPDNAIYVGRPTKFGNPFQAGKWYIPVDACLSNPFSPEWKLCKTIEQSVELYREYIEREVKYKRLDLHELIGHNLACWCNLKNCCHADVLIEMINNLSLNEK